MNRVLFGIYTRILLILRSRSSKLPPSNDVNQVGSSFNRNFEILKADKFNSHHQP